MAAVAALPALAQESARLRSVDEVLAPLVESHGVSGMEAPVRETVQRLLPAWARTVTDTAGNLWLTMGKGEPTVVFVAHLDEIGFTVTGIRDDGTLDAVAAGGLLSVALGRAARPRAHRWADRARRIRPARLRRAAARARRGPGGARRPGHREPSGHRGARRAPGAHRDQPQAIRQTARQPGDRPVLRRSGGLDGAGACRARARSGAAQAHGDLRLERTRGDRPGGRERGRRCPGSSPGAGTRHRYVRLGRLAARAAELRRWRPSAAGRWRARSTTARSRRRPTSTP